MIEEKKQLQVSSGEKTYTTGSHVNFVQDVKSKLEGIELNALEQGLLERYLQDQDTCAKNVCGLLKKIAAKCEEKDDRYSLKKIRKVIPLFDEHDFFVCHFGEKIPLVSFCGMCKVVLTNPVGVVKLKNHKIFCCNGLSVAVANRIT